MAPESLFNSMFDRTVENDEVIYTLRSIFSNIDPSFSSEVIYTVSSAEHDCVRTDERAHYLPYKRALRRNLVLIEALCSMRIAGNRLHLSNLLEMEFKDFLDREELGDSLPHVHSFPQEHDAVADEALSLANLMHWANRRMSEERAITRGLFLEVHHKLAVEAGVQDSGWRSTPRPRIPMADGWYQPPMPHEIDELMSDLIEFSNMQFSCPTVHAAVTHFYLEAIIPFDWGMDRIGRLLAHMLYTRTGMWRNLILPIGVLPAIATKEHARALLPWMMENGISAGQFEASVNNWIAYCAQAMAVASRISSIYTKQIARMIETWQAQLGDVRKDSALRAMLYELPATPVFNISYLAQRLDRSFTSVSDAVDRMVDAGVVKQISEGKRNRVFEVTDVLALHTWVEEQILPRNINAREAYLIFT